LLYEDRDYHVQDYFINNSYPTLDEIKTVYNSILNAAKIAVGSEFIKRILIDNQIIQLLANNKINQTKLNSALKVLDNNKLIDFSSDKINFSFIKILFESEQLKTFLQKFAQDLNREILLFLLREFSNSIFTDKKKIDINYLANKLSAPINEIIESLTKLSNSGIIEFTIPSNKPSIKLIGGRISPDNLRINVEHHFALRDNAKLKLDLMRSFAFTNDCRFKLILNYFGEEVTNYNCGKCDNCRSEDYQNKPQLEYLEEIVIDTIHKATGRIRQNDLIKILTGNDKHGNLRNNPNFGVCKHFKKDELLDIIDSLISKNLIKKFDSQIAITELGKDIFALPEEIIVDNNTTSESTYNLQLVLLNKLKELRKRIAKKFSQPEQIICNDNLLREIAKDLPTSPSQLLAINGFTQWMFNKIGEDILETILDFKIENRKLLEKVSESKVETEIKLPENLEKTYKLLQDKYSLEDIASLSKLPEAVISMQIESLFDYFPKLEISSIMKKHEIELIEKEIKKGIEDIKELKEILPSFISYGKIRIMLAKNK